MPDASSRDGVTLVSQCSADHTHSIRAIAKLWNGPMSVAIHAKGGARWREGVGLGAALPLKLLDGLQPQRLAIVHVESKDVRVDGHTPGSYPINALRNAAIQRARTSHVFICDIDFLPSEGLYGQLLGLVLGRTVGGAAQGMLGAERLRPEEQATMAGRRVAVVVPAFRLKGKCREPSGSAGAALSGPARSRMQLKCFEHYQPRVPRHYEALKRCLEAGWCETFCPNCHTHGSTDYTAWWAQRALLRRVTCFDSMRYEPYVLVERHAQLPPFDEHYFGYGKNKIQWIAHLQYAGYEFHVVKEGFVIHVPHYPSVDKDEWNQAMRDMPHVTVDWHVRFLRFLRKSYPNYTLPRCAQFYEFL